MITDSGNRKTYETGAVRDVQEGKGRPTLMPLKVVSRLLSKQTGDYIFQSIAAFTETGETKYLYAALLKFVVIAYSGETETMLPKWQFISRRALRSTVRTTGRRVCL